MNSNVDESKPKETILITGAVGMIGSRTERGLLEAGKRVVGFVSSCNYNACETFEVCVKTRLLFLRIGA